MNIEDLRSFFLSLSGNVVEKFPFQQFKTARNALAFYTGGHIFCYSDINELRHVTVKYRKEDMSASLEEYDCLELPYYGNLKYWIGTDATRAEMALLKRLITDSFRLTVKKK